MEVKEWISYIIQGVVLGYLLAWILVTIGGELVFLFSDAGRWFNTDTIPLQAALEILITALYSPWTFLLCVITIPLSTMAAAMGVWSDLFGSWLD